MGLKPDLVIVDDVRKEAFVIDVAISFEGTGIFAEARAAKKSMGISRPFSDPKVTSEWK